MLFLLVDVATSALEITTSSDPTTGVINGRAFGTVTPHQSSLQETASDKSSSKETTADDDITTEVTTGEDSTISISDHTGTET